MTYMYTEIMRTIDDVLKNDTLQRDQNKWVVVVVVEVVVVVDVHVVAVVVVVDVVMVVMMVIDNCVFIRSSVPDEFIYKEGKPVKIQIQADIGPKIAQTIIVCKSVHFYPISLWCVLQLFIPG